MKRMIGLIAAAAVGCTSTYTVRGGDLAEAQALLDHGAEEVAIAARDEDGDDTFVRVTKLRGVPIETGGGLVEARFRDPRSGLLYTGIPVAILGVLIGTLTIIDMRDCAASCDAYEAVGRGFLHLLGLSAGITFTGGGIAMIVTGLVLQGPEEYGPSGGFPPTIDGPRESPPGAGLQLHGRF